ncbi:hypothetical protein [Aureimonas pseudogalii]|uniref:Uncharacterized protein n=1 Tax=Aureimonas pseudogalii TaxID=1744844 RepID=A0A7W6ECR6_9HYPH|nr:hypothetical protein [Aureimonas pseudogalii]MBB3996897.1 hypothetical protein [Aureimonas pseudogalii]
MSTKSDKARIIALQKALRIARAALERHSHDAACEDALSEILKLDLNSKPTPLQGLVGSAAGRR